MVLMRRDATIGRDTNCVSASQPDQRPCECRVDGADEGIDATISKTACVPELWSGELYIFRPLQFTAASVVKVATEPPLNPSGCPRWWRIYGRSARAIPWP
jgi:hypothetical protein